MEQSKGKPRERDPAIRSIARALRHRVPYTGTLAMPLTGSGQAELAEKMVQLFAWHDVDPGDWCALAWELARSHVPGFRSPARRRKRGRPQLAKQSKPVGRPREWSADTPQMILALLDHWRAEQMGAGVAKPKDADFLRWVAKLHAEKYGLQVRAVERSESGRLRNLLSRAKKSVSKPSRGD